MDTWACVILCGGKATRLQGINKGEPKALLKVFGRCLLSNLIENLPDKFSEILISYSGDRQKFSEAFEMELSDSKRSKLVLVKDAVQLGTAYAVKNLHLENIDYLCVLNGDTLFDEYSSLLPEKIPECSAVFSTSFQVIGRASKVNSMESHIATDLTQDRYGQNETKDWVNNGCVTVDMEVINKLQEWRLSEGESLEKALHQMALDGHITLKLHRSSSNFIDIGLREDYLNADSIYENLINGRIEN